MQEAEIYSKLTTIFHDVLDDDTIVLAPEMTASDIDGWHSLNHINLILAAEAEFEVRFTTGEIESLEKVGDFVRLIQTKAA